MTVLPMRVFVSALLVSMFLKLQPAEGSGHPALSLNLNQACRELGGG